jgi:hypothetical protein
MELEIASACDAHTFVMVWGNRERKATGDGEVIIIPAPHFPAVAATIYFAVLSGPDTCVRSRPASVRFCC